MGKDGWAAEEAVLAQGIFYSVRPVFLREDGLFFGLSSSKDILVLEVVSSFILPGAINTKKANHPKGWDAKPLA